ncbi:unnamed protein product [Protopolystoma xenopodis]|uniref:Uncharacterized protein n=1 Tax=Protopolystoma xenopodis TaxID=117903 RepID=A0A448XQM3_9PLAT|nr:unnamed protein product [Protopolystoma xenopodis]
MPPAPFPLTPEAEAAVPNPCRSSWGTDKGALLVALLYVRLVIGSTVSTHQLPQVPETTESSSLWLGHRFAFSSLLPPNASQLPHPLARLLTHTHTHKPERTGV